MNLTVKIGSRVLIKDINIDLSYDSICVLGYSGSGKSLLLKALEKSGVDGSFYYPSKKNAFVMEKEILSVASSCSWLFLDDVSLYFDGRERLNLFKKIMDSGCHLFYVSRDVEDILAFSYCYVLYQNMVGLEGLSHSIVLEEKVMKLIGYSLPFYVDLSLQLKYYGLLDNICYSKEELEKCLWPKS